MEKIKLLFRNSAMGLIWQIANILFTFVTRSVFIRTLGIELQSINSTFSSVLSTLSLAELGIQSAIIYSLYRPLHENDAKAIKDIMNIYKTVYRVIGVFFVAASMISLPLLKYILTGVEINASIYAYFILQAMANACSYFLAYKRSLLYADQKDYVAKIIDTVMNILFNCVECASLILFRNYILFLILKAVHIWIDNLLVHIYCTKKYPYLKKDKINNEQLKKTLKNVKYIFAGKIAAYIYGATDNLVVSIFKSTISVGYLTNYTVVTKSIRNVITTMLSPLQPVVGEFMVDKSNGKEGLNFFYLCTHVRYIISLLVILPTTILIDEFVYIWLGKDMIIPDIWVYLLAADLYIDIVGSAALDFINASGLFKKDRNVELTGAAINIVSSVILVQIIGVAGVLMGTVISQIVFWIGRSYIVIFKCLKRRWKDYVKYWLRNLVYLLLFYIGYYLCLLALGMINIKMGVIHFIVSGTICVMFMLAYVALVFVKDSEQKKLFSLMKKTIKIK